MSRCLVYSFIRLNIHIIYIFSPWNDMCENEIPTVIQKWSVLTSHLNTQHIVLQSIGIYDNMWDVGKCHTCCTAIFYFSLNKVDSASDAAVASILSSTSSNWNNSFQFFFTSPFCPISEFHLPTSGHEWGTVIFATGWDCGDVSGGIWIDGNIANFASSKVHFSTIFLSNFMSISFHCLMSLLCKHVISWHLLTKCMILKSIVAGLLSGFFVFIVFTSKTAQNHLKVFACRFLGMAIVVIVIRSLSDQKFVG